MNPRIETLPEKKLMGQRMTMSLSNNKTRELWQNFMPRRKEIQNYIGTNLYSMQIYDSLYFNNFDPKTEFEKWATIEVTDFDIVPAELETVTVPSGLYAVFTHKGDASMAPKTFEYIFTNWLPNSDYLLDNRPHFEILGEKYKNNDPTSEEEIWIPIQLKK
ncbi:AraC family transcriptional regulator [Flavobacterium sp. CG_23.5]|uniref:GyrI-like domain-containing protein n=1 Tax=unclassified Flavobacterium TaxID=196869 RepID=UPI0018CB516A|nr:MULTISPECIES: GyrI-like domain-containing protein [unclassified Flavobacterium]MBG6111282.1 AraC family transcriptional regulator [Flavobacterium sp. CG_9.10]MBP2282070.1 AraC family transcriptional regulator [Flavobacterium sp. CG_23.5]